MCCISTTIQLPVNKFDSLVFLQVVVAAFKECLDNDVYIPMYNKSQTDSPTSPHSTFFQVLNTGVALPKLTVSLGNLMR